MFLLNAGTVQKHRAPRAMCTASGEIRASRKGNGTSVECTSLYPFVRSSGCRELQRFPSDLNGSKTGKHRPCEPCMRAYLALMHRLEQDSVKWRAWAQGRTECTPHWHLGLWEQKNPTAWRKWLTTATLPQLWRKVWNDWPNS